MKASPKLLNYFLYFSLVAIGIVVGIAIHHYYSLPLSEEINIIDLATLVATVFLAVYIPEVLDRHSQIMKDKKDLIENRIVELQALYRNVNLLIQGEEPIKARDLLVVQNTLDVTRNKWKTIVTLLTYSNMHASFTREIGHIEQLAEEHRRLLLVDQVNPSDFVYPDDIQQQEEALYNQIDEATKPACL
ncbi:MAG: hypothetical protein LUD02_12175 [Tannerellaceae bacterium]|nr:hypothetical protein [Tannerellaceae bacterium]MCD8264801.1 hypothetical protein [Tannerellaceae bacterium]